MRPHPRMAILSAAALISIGASSTSAGPAAAAAACPITQVSSGYRAGTATISDDGRWIAFSSNADPVGQNADYSYEIFRYDTTTRRTTQVTRTTKSSNGSPVISGDGSRIAFLSTANLTGGNADRNTEVFLHTGGTQFRQITNETLRASIDGLGLDREGKRLVWHSPGDFTGENPDHDEEIFFHDTAGTGTTSQISDISNSLDQGEAPAISDDGTRITYVDVLYENDPTPGGGGNNHYQNVFLYDTATRRTTDLTGQRNDGHSAIESQTLSGNGRRMAFHSDLDLLGSNGDLNREIFSKDLGTGVFSQLTRTSSGTGTSMGAFSLDDAGANLAFETSRNVTGGNPDFSYEIFLRRPSGAITQITDSTSDGSYAPRISGDGKRIVFVSFNDLTGENPGGLSQVFLADCGGSSASAPRPDAQIRKGSTEPFRGGDVYNTTGADQTRSAVAARGTTVTFSVRVQNDRRSADSFRIRGATGDTASFRVRYFAGATDITSQVVAGTYAVNGLAPGATRTIQMKVTVKPGAAAGTSISRRVTISSATDSTAKDVVKAIVRRA